MKKDERKYVHHFHHTDGKVFVVKLTAWALDEYIADRRHMRIGDFMLNEMEENPNHYAHYELVEILGEKL